MAVALCAVDMPLSVQTTEKSSSLPDKEKKARLKINFNSIYTYYLFARPVAVAHSAILPILIHTQTLITYSPEHTQSTQNTQACTQYTCQTNRLNKFRKNQSL